MNDGTQQPYGDQAETATPNPDYGAPAGGVQSTHSPARAALCALIPGLGAVYNRQYQKAVIHFAVFAALTEMSAVNGLFVMAAIAFYLFMMIDAYRSAEVIARSGHEVALEEDSSQEMQHLPLWGGFLVAIGIVFLLDNMGLIHLRQVLEFWPLLFIALGGYILYAARSGSSDGRRSVLSSGSSQIFAESGSQSGSGKELE